MTEETLFHEALSKAPIDRAAFLDDKCVGNPALRAAVEALLAAHEAPGSFLNKPVNPLEQTLDSEPGPVNQGGTGEFTPEPDKAHNATTDYRPKADASQVIGGRYTLQQKIGEGGMGEVWVAQQTEPVKRKVALKLIKTGMDSRSVLARFEQERQALAIMDHPNIARVLDGGMTPTGQPFFVMELVNGLALTKFCDDAKLTPRQRLELFIPICQAVQHAHQKGIVHRDLKPANILVTMIDGRPVPKVIDFGVAKATGANLTDEAMNTQFGAVVGTLEYMSPEQAGFSGVDIDTRADIYSLGVILYELLTGLRPIDSKRLKKAALAEMIRIIQEEEPSKPSTRLSTDEALPSLAAVRQTDPKKLMAELRGELDWVVMKCLEKQRDRRYETANALVRDIQRYLTDEPVEARPPSVGYRFQKMLRRNRAAVLSIGAVAAALLIGIVLTTWQAVRATNAEDEQRKEREKAELLAIANGKLAKVEAEQRESAEKQKAKAEAESQRADRERLAAETAKYAMQLKLVEVHFQKFDIQDALRILKSTKPELRGWEYDHLAMKCHSRMRTFADDDAYSSVAISPDGKRVAGGNRKQVRIWDFTSRQLLKEFEGDALNVEVVAFSPDGRRLAAITSESVRVWDVASWKQLGRAQLKPPANPLPFTSTPSLAFNAAGDQLAVCVQGELYSWNDTLSTELFSLKASELRAPEKGGYTGVAFAPDGKRLAARLVVVSVLDGRMFGFTEEYLLLEATTAKQLVTSGRESITNAWGNAMGFDSHGKLLLASGGQSLKLRDPATAKVQRETNLGVGMGNVVAISGNADRLAVMRMAASAIAVFKLPDLDALQSLPFDFLDNRPDAIGISADGCRVVSASRGYNKGSVVGWILDGDDATVNVATRESKLFQNISGITSNVEAGWLAVAITESEPIDPKMIPKLKPPFDPKMIPKLKPPFQPKTQCYVDFHSLKTGERLFSLPNAEGRIWLMQASRDGQTLCTADLNGPIRVWDVAGRKVKRELSAAGPEGSVRIVVDLSMDAAAKFVCATIDEKQGNTGRIRMLVWETASGKTVWENDWENEAGLTGGLSSRNSAVLDPAGSRLVVIRGTFHRGPEDPDTGRFIASITSDVKLYNLSTKEVLSRLDFKDSVAATFSYSGKHIYLSGRGIVRWDPVSGAQTRLSDLFVRRLIVTPTDERLIALELPLPKPGILHVIDPKTSQVVYQVPNAEMRYSMNGVHLTDDGRTLIVADNRKAQMLRSREPASK